MATNSAQFGYGMLIAQGIANTITALGSFGISKHSNAAAQAQANIARINAQMMERQYQATLRASEKAIVSKTMAAGHVKSAQRVALAANGIAVGEGSAAEMQASTDIVKEMDVNQIKSNALSEAWGYRWKGVGYEAQALQAEAQKVNKWDAFGTTLLGGASQVANSYMLMSASGVFDKNAGASSSRIGTKAYGDQAWSGTKKWTVDANGKWW